MKVLRWCQMCWKRKYFVPILKEKKQNIFPFILTKTECRINEVCITFAILKRKKKDNGSFLLEYKVFGNRYAEWVRIYNLYFVFDWKEGNVLDSYFSQYLYLSKNSFNTSTGYKLPFQNQLKIFIYELNFIQKLFKNLIYILRSIHIFF